jgi:group I intron endonuclease
MAIVYRITNLINKKCYVGQSIYDIEHRWKRHLSAARCGSKFRFHSAIRKYGPDPWKLEVIFSSDDMNEIRKYEENIILNENLTHNKIGYNAKPGGCGRWIVKDENKETWRKNMAKAMSGLGNSNAGLLTNDELIKICIECSNHYGYIPGFPKFKQYGESIGKQIPKMFSKFRFNGKYANLAKIVQQKTNLDFLPHFRDEEARKNASLAQLKRKE